MAAPSPTKFRRSPKPITPTTVATVAAVNISRRVAEKIPRDWTVKKPDSDFIQQIFVTCKSLAKAMHGAGKLALAVYDLKPQQLAFFWVSKTDDLVLIFPTHSKGKCAFSKSDLENLEKSFTWEFENSLAVSLLKKRNVGYQFLRIEKYDGQFHCALSPVIFANLWEKLFENGALPEVHSLNDRFYIDGVDIVSTRKTKSLSVVDSHEYRVPLNRISDTMKKVILGKKSFARIVPHGHIHQVHGEKLINRSPNDPHPYFDQLLKRYEGRAIFLNCDQCSSSMVGFYGDTTCALCTNPAEPQPKKAVHTEHGPGFFKVIRNKLGE